MSDEDADSVAVTTAAIAPIVRGCTVLRGLLELVECVESAMRGRSPAR